MGKTRLALRFATTRKARFRSVWFCDMRDARGAGDMSEVVLRAFGCSSPSGDADAAVLRALAARPDALLVLDNFEHLLPEGAAILKHWMSAARDVHFIVTSRVALGIPGEQTIELGGVTVTDAVALFVERVRARNGEPPQADLAGIGEIVRRLELVPLAIELAAARYGDEDLTSLLGHLGGPGAQPIDMAFALLPEGARRTLALCSLFRGSFSVQAAIALAGEPASKIVVDLASRSLLQVVRYRPMRFAMCEGMRMLAGALLSPSEASAAALRHARFFAERARAIADRDDAVADAEDDWEDLPAAAAFAAQEHPDLVLQIALALDVLSPGTGLGATQLGFLDDALRRGAACDLGLLARALLVRAAALYGLGRVMEARRDAETALSLALELGDDKRGAASDLAAALYAYQLGDIEAAREHLGKALERGRGDPTTVATAYCQLGTIHNSLGELDGGRSMFERSLMLMQGCGDLSGEVFARLGLAWNYFESGDRPMALLEYQRTLALARRTRMTRSERVILGYVGLVYFDTGDLVKAEDHLRRSTLASRRAGEVRTEGIFEGVRAGVLAALGRVGDARPAFALADDLLSRNPFYQRAIAVHRGHLDLAEARAAREIGMHNVAEAHVGAARWRIEEARSHAKRSDDARAAVRILQRAIDRI